MGIVKTLEELVSKAFADLHRTCYWIEDVQLLLRFLDSNVEAEIVCQRL